MIWSQPIKHLALHHYHHHHHHPHHPHHLTNTPPHHHNLHQHPSITTNRTTTHPPPRKQNHRPAMTPAPQILKVGTVCHYFRAFLLTHSSLTRPETYTPRSSHQTPTGAVKCAACLTVSIFFNTISPTGQSRRCKTATGSLYVRLAWTYSTAVLP